MLILDFIKPITYYVLITFLFALFYINRTWMNKCLIIILFVSVVTEIISILLKYNGMSIGIHYSISMILTGGIWLFMISKLLYSKKTVDLVLIVFLLFSLINILFFEGMVYCNFATFIFGALLYIGLFIYGSFYQLKKENFTFFQSKNYFLLFSPVLFFFGLSFVFGYKSKAVAETIIFGHIKLYEFIVYFVNIIYYTLINIYIYRERKFKHA